MDAETQAKITESSSILQQADQHRKAGRLDEAIQVYTRAYEVAPSNQMLGNRIQALLRRGVSYRLSSNPAEAVRDLEAALRMIERSQWQSHFGFAPLLLGICQVAGNDLSSARLSFKLATNWAVQFHKPGHAVLLAICTPEELIPLVADCTSLIQADARFAPAYFGRAICNQGARRYDLALQDYQQASALDATLKTLCATQIERLKNDQQVDERRHRQVGPSQSDRLLPGVDYARLDWDGESNSIQVAFYNRNQSHTQSYGSSQSIQQISKDLQAQGYRLVDRMAHKEGETHYFQRGSGEGSTSDSPTAQKPSWLKRLFGGG